MMKRFLKAVAVIALVGGIVFPAGSATAATLSTAEASRYALPAPPTASGESATLLPDGTWLLLGGEVNGTVSNAAAIYDGTTGQATMLTATLNVARAWQTATVLPSGQVFIFGGIGPDGKVVSQAELYDPLSQQFTLGPDTGLTPRAHHTANLLTDGRVLIAGGQHGEPPQLWDPRTNTVTAAGSAMVVPRADAGSTLLSTSPVLIFGGTDANGAAVSSSELYAPSLDLFEPADSISSLLPSLATLEAPPAIAASLPSDGATDVAVSAQLAVRFSKRLAVQSINSATVTLIGPTGAIPVTVVPAEEGLLLFVTPTQELLPSSSYTLFIQGAADLAGTALPTATIGFSTAAVPAPTPGTGGSTGSTPSGSSGVSVVMGPPLSSNATSSAVGLWQPPMGQGHPWIMGPVTKSAAANAPLLQAPAGVTALSGRVLLQNGTPLPGVAVSVGALRTVTDAAGRFLLSPLPAGHVEFIVDGRTADGDGQHYGQFVIGADLNSGVTNTLDYTVWMPVIDVADAVNIPSPTTQEVDVTSPLLPGVVLKIPPGTVIREPDGRIATSVGLTPVPLDRSPFPLPPFSMYFVIQPGGAVIQSVTGDQRPGVQIVYPNTLKRPPGSPDTFMYYDPSGKGWTTYGQGRVSASGDRIDPDSSVSLYSFSGFGDLESSNPPPPKNPPPGGCGGSAGDPVDCYTGVFVYRHTDLVVRDTIPIVIRRTYQSSDTYPRDFGVGFSHDYHMYLYDVNGPTDTNFSTLSLVLSNGSLIQYTRTASSPSTGLTGLQMTSAETPSRFVGSTLTYDPTSTYLVLSLKDGTEYKFNSTDGRFLRQIVDRNGEILQVIPADPTSGDNTPDVTIVSPHGRWVTFQYASTNDFSYPAGTSEVTQITDDSGRSVSYAYDSAGRLVTVTYPDGGIERYTYVSTTSNEIQSIIAPNGQTKVTNSYDSSGRVIQQTLANGGTYQFSYTTNSSGQAQTTVTDPNGDVHILVFNSTGYVVSDTRAANDPAIEQVTTLQRDPTSNLVTSSTDALGRTTDYGYDALGNLTNVTRLAGTADAVTYSATYTANYNEIASLTDPLGHTTSFRYDSLGNLTGVTDALGNLVATFTNDPSTGLPVSITDALGHTTTLGYDSEADLASITDPLGRTTTRYFDTIGRLIEVLDPLKDATTYAYDPMDRLTQITDALGHTTTLAYDADGNLTSVTDPRNDVTRYAYDKMDRLSTRTDALGQTESFSYDADGNRISYTDRKGQVDKMSYDALNRLTTVLYGDQSGTSQSTVSYTYDAGNRLTQLADSTGGTITRVYDGLDRLTSETTPKGSITYGYDGASRRIQMTVGGQGAVTYGYDADNRLTSLTQGGNTVGVQYDAVGRRVTLALPNGIVVGYGYDAANELTGLTYTLGSTTVGNLTYTYDAAGHLVNRGGSLDTTSLPATIASATYDADNRLTQWGSSTLSYDADGNLTNDGTLSYTWNARNQLTALSGAHTASFTYDALGRRESATIDGTTTGYLYDGLNPVQEQGATTTTNLLTGPSLDEYFERSDGTTTRYFLTDAQNSTVALTDPSGNVVKHYTYDPYGTTTATGETSTNPFQYTGRENDATGLYYNRARYYSPTTGRFVSSDPIGLAGGLNTYSYTDDNPLRYIDPLGLVQWTGTYSSIGVIYGGGAVRFVFNLTSECVGGVRARAKVLAGGFAVGFGAVATGTSGSITFEDGLSTPDPFVFEGRAKFVGAGLAFGPKNPSPGIARPTGIGVSAAAIQLGGARSLDYGWEYGLDASVFGGAGISTVQDASRESCSCNAGGK
ncbi:MAG: RHS repeat-associated core domain-containing protein [Acidobacteriaceae bacterium]